MLPVDSRGGEKRSWFWLVSRLGMGFEEDGDSVERPMPSQLVGQSQGRRNLIPREGLGEIPFFPHQSAPGTAQPGKFKDL